MRHGWQGSLLALPGALLALLPSVSCPACLAAYAGVLSSVGLGFLHNERVLAPLIAAFLVANVATIGWSARSHGRRGPLLGAVTGAVAVTAGRLVWQVPPALYAGLVVLIGASLWNLWLKRSRRQALIQIRIHPKEGR